MTSKIDFEGFETRAIHAGQSPDPSTGVIMMPIYATSTYVQESHGVHQGFEYPRSHNPTRQALEVCIADLEGGGTGLALASGMSAIVTVLEILDTGERVIAMDDLYGGTYRLFQNVRKRSASLEFSFADLSDNAQLEASLQPDTKMIQVETPTNSLLRLVDLAAVATFAKRHNLIAVCDNTICAPFVQQPLEFGFDLVVYFATKYINGHSDVVDGIVVCARQRQDLAEAIVQLSNAIGRSSDGRIWRNDQRGCSRGPESARQLLKRTQIFPLAESLGGVESLIEHPSIMTHASLPRSVHQKIGLVDGLVRLSVGIETLDDIIGDLAAALDTL